MVRFTLQSGVSCQSVIFAIYANLCFVISLVSLTQNFNVTDSDLTQDGDVGVNLTMSGFAIDFTDKNETTPQFTVGEVVKTTVK